MKVHQIHLFFSQPHPHRTQFVHLAQIVCDSRGVDFGVVKDDLIALAGGGSLKLDFNLMTEANLATGAENFNAQWTPAQTIHNLGVGVHRDGAIVSPSPLHQQVLLINTTPRLDVSVVPLSHAALKTMGLSGFTEKVLGNFPRSMGLAARTGTYPEANYQNLFFSGAYTLLPQDLYPSPEVFSRLLDDGGSRTVSRVRYFLTSSFSGSTGTADFWIDSFLHWGLEMLRDGGRTEAWEHAERPEERPLGRDWVNPNTGGRYSGLCSNDDGGRPSMQQYQTLHFLEEGKADFEPPPVAHYWQAILANDRSSITYRQPFNQVSKQINLRRAFSTSSRPRDRLPLQFTAGRRIFTRALRWACTRC